jgi:DNA excision repair protein ERCC-4
MKLPARLDPSQVVCIIDSREQNALNLEPLTSVTSTLPTGDYSVRGLEHVVAIERKSLQDLVACVGTDRERFDREVQRLLAYPVRILVIESSWEAIESHEPINPQWRGKVTREAVLGSLMGWQASGLSVHMAGDHQRSGRHVARLLYHVANRRYRELRALTGGES